MASAIGHTSNTKKSKTTYKRVVVDDKQMRRLNKDGKTFKT